VPSVVGRTWAVAKQMLTDAGFKLKYSPAADAVANAIIVTKTDPPAGASVAKGTTVHVNFGF